ncbi:MAG TPA: hypothetical protein VN158_16545 [Caulobacter sp.]|nr:hypothetical protein [Caulobacter sp.]
MPRQSLVRLGLVCILAAAALPASAQRPPSDESWGKPGVSYLQYRTDAVECAYKVGQEAPVSIPMVDLVFPMDMPVIDPVDAAGAVDTSGALNSSTYDTVKSLDTARARMTKPWREIVRQVRPALAQCLTERGYRRFRLTKDQHEQLKALPTGTRARHVYLWAIAIDPEVQRRQVLRR